MSFAAHYLDRTRTPELEALAAMLPASMRGDWVSAAREGGDARTQTDHTPPLHPALVLERTVDAGCVRRGLFGS